MTQKKAAGGRPSKYKPEFAEQAKHLCRLGATTQQLGDAFGVDSRTIERWMGKYPEFCRTIKEEKRSADEEVERALYQRATGYSHDDVKVMQYEGVPVIVPIEKHYPPDTGACVFWLQNRQPDKYRPRKAVEENPTDPNNKADMLLKAIAERLPD